MRSCLCNLSAPPRTAAADSIEEEGSSIPDLALGEEAEANRPSHRKIIVTGARQSGKSTFVRQLRALHDGPPDEAERSKFGKAVRKSAINHLKQVLRLALPSILDEQVKGEALELLSLQGRALLSEDTVTRFARIFASIDIDDTFSDMECGPGDLNFIRYFVSRLEAMSCTNFVPTQEDLLRHYSPTLGSQESKLQSTRNGAFSLVEYELDKFFQFLDSSLTMRSDTTPALIFVISAADFEFRASPDIARKSDCDTGIPPEGSPEAWLRLCKIASKVEIPCYLLVSKFDSLSDPHKVSCREKILELCMSQSQNPPAATTFKTVNLLELKYVKEISAEMLQAIFCPAGASTNELDQGVYLGLAHFAGMDLKETTVLMENKMLPCRHIQSNPLSFVEHEWLQQLPQPIPSTIDMGALQRARCGANHQTGSFQLNFWFALCSLNKLLPNSNEFSLGTLHTTPLLMAPATAMLVLRNHVATVKIPLELNMIPFSDAVQCMAPIHAAELRTYRRERRRSYLPEMEVQSRRSTKELSSKVWLSRIHERARGKSAEFSEGTYVCAFYLCSSMQGLKVLVPDDDLSTLPAVKISNSCIKLDEWMELNASIRNFCAESHPHLVLNRDLAASWMGPDVSSESELTRMEKFIYGVQILRQQLERDCTTTSDRFGLATDEMVRHSIESLGKLLPLTHLPSFDKARRTRMLVVAHYYPLDCIDEFPPWLQWQPLELFEARHFSRFLSDEYQTYLSIKEKIGGMNMKRRSSITIKARDDDEDSCSGSNPESGDEDLDDTLDPSELIERLESAWGLCRWPRAVTLRTSSLGCGESKTGRRLSGAAKRLVMTKRRSSLGGGARRSSVSGSGDAGFLDFSTLESCPTVSLSEFARVACELKVLLRLD